MVKCVNFRVTVSNLIGKIGKIGTILLDKFCNNSYTKIAIYV